MFIRDAAKGQQASPLGDDITDQENPVKEKQTCKFTRPFRPPPLPFEFFLGGIVSIVIKVT
jgi:hypothetical protein